VNPVFYISGILAVLSGLLWIFCKGFEQGADYERKRADAAREADKNQKGFSR
jgi:hypothetical protein